MTSQNQLKNIYYCIVLNGLKNCDFSDKLSANTTMPDFKKDYYIGLKKYYFYRILNTIVRIGDLRNRNIRILDFGCGAGKLKKILGEKVINYDVIPEYSEIRDWTTAPFDLLVSNAVFYLFSEQELKYFLDKLYQVNPRVELLVAIARQNFLSKIGKFLLNQEDAHQGTKLTSRRQIEIIKEKMEVIKKKNVFFICDVYLLKYC